MISVFNGVLPSERSPSATCAPAGSESMRTQDDWSVEDPVDSDVVDEPEAAVGFVRPRLSPTMTAPRMATSSAAHAPTTVSDVRRFGGVVMTWPLWSADAMGVSDGVPGWRIVGRITGNGIGA